MPAATRIDGYTERAEQWARAAATRAPLTSEAEIIDELCTMHKAGLLSLPLGGDGFHHDLLQGLAWVGYGSLALGRLIEGHLNALLLVQRFGTAAQAASAMQLAVAGKLFGVWNTGEAEPVRLQEQPDGQMIMQGRKTFGSGASIVQRPIVTADLPNAGWQMTLIPMERATLTIDRESWKPMGMEASFSFDIDFTGTVLQPQDLIGAPNDFYREPAFSGGAVRFAAVHAGGARRLVDDFTQWLRVRNRGADPHQAMRLSQCVQTLQETLLWVDHAAQIAETHFSTQDPQAAARMVHAADMTRTAVERNAAEIMRLVTVGVGAHGLLHPNPFGTVLRDLTMYLRQPAPDRIAMRIAEYHLAHDTFASASIQPPTEPIP